MHSLTVDCVIQLKEKLLFQSVVRARLPDFQIEAFPYSYKHKSRIACEQNIYNAGSKSRELHTWQTICVFSLFNIAVTRGKCTSKKGHVEVDDDK